MEKCNSTVLSTAHSSMEHVGVITRTTKTRPCSKSGHHVSGKGSIYVQNDLDPTPRPDPLVGSRSSSSRQQEGTQTSHEGRVKAVDISSRLHHTFCKLGSPSSSTNSTQETYCSWHRGRMQVGWAGLSKHARQCATPQDVYFGTIHLLGNASKGYQGFLLDP